MKPDEKKVRKIFGSDDNVINYIIKSAGNVEFTKKKGWKKK